MANTTEVNTGIRRPVAVSSTSSLDSFTTNLPTTAHQEAEIYNSDHSLPPIIPLLNDRFSDSSIINTTYVHNPLATTQMQPTLVPNPTTPAPVPIVPSHPSVTSLPSVPSAAAAAAAPANNTVAEFLYQLTKMLTDDNREVIEWSNSKIEVHNPTKLASDVLHKYFRHSKFASFQRQLNYFGFRKLAGKGKMAPCSYVNDAATSDLRSLLLIKRKTTPVTATGKGPKKRERQGSESGVTTVVPQVNPVLAGILQRSSSGPDMSKSAAKMPKLASGKGIKHQLNGYLKAPVAGAPANGSHIALAQRAVGKGIRHRFSSTVALPTPQPSTKDATEGVVATAALASAAPPFTFQDPHQLGMDIQNSLSELSNNFKNSLKEAPAAVEAVCASPQGFGMLSRNSSLVDLAMLHPVEPTPVSELQNTCDPVFMSFVDFPHSDLESPELEL